MPNKTEYLPRSEGNKLVKLHLHQDTWDALDRICEAAKSSDGSTITQPSRSVVLTRLINNASHYIRKDFNE